MSGPLAQKKKNKKKKKSSPVVNPDPPPPVPLTEICQNGSEKDTFSINEVLPQKVGMKTVFKDVEVTMTHSGSTSEVANGISSKKKKKNKKKKAKSAPTELAQEAASGEVDNQNNFFKFKDDHIELLNHPEISVTFSKSVEISKKEDTESSVKVASSATDIKQEISPVAAETKKKKKNKKKKKKAPENTVPVESTSEAADPSYTAPTYVKLPASGDSCVLLVSHESFSNDTKTSTNNSEKETVPNNSKTVLVQSKERREELQGISAFNSNCPSVASVSIFPVVPEPNKMPEKSTEISMDSSLQKVGNLIKKEIEGESVAPHTEKESEANPNETTLTKAQLKAERRAKQEAQRAAKLAKSGENKPSTAQPNVQLKTPIVSESLPLTKSSVAENTTVANKVSTKSAEREIPRNMFSHLPQFKDSNQFSNKITSNIHPAILEIGSYYRNGVVFGSNARCLGFLAAFSAVIRDHKAPPNKDLDRDLEAKLQSSLDFLNSCRPLSVSILNSVRFLKHQINHIPKDMPEEKVKEDLCILINNFVKEEILLAKEAICISATAKIVDGDIILVFAYSSLVKDVLCKAHNQNKSFQVIVVESRCKKEGNEMLRRLLKHGLSCSYVPASSACSTMKTVSKVIIGAHALLANGSVMSRVGSMKIVETAESCSVPVFVCCETYKFCERALTDSFVHNELADVENLAEISLDKNDNLKKSLQIHNILYDVTPSELISVVITEKGLLPCTSVPVVLRVKQAGLQE